jgi:tetratricopeptide (TPR) repeat protein
VSELTKRRLAGFAAGLKGDRAEALEHFRATAALDPEHVGTMLDVAAELYELGRLDEAAVAYHDVLARDPHPLLGWRGPGYVALRRGKRGEALEHFIAAAELDLDSAWSMIDVAAALRELGQLDEAEDVYYEVVAKYPRIPQGFIGLGHLSRQRGDRGAALEYFRVATALEPKNAEGLSDIATALRELGEEEEKGAKREIGLELQRR